VGAAARLLRDRRMSLSGECSHEYFDMDYSLNQETMCLYISSITCRACGATATAEIDGEIALGPWKEHRKFIQGDRQTDNPFISERADRKQS
jgi:hypothetical protein